MSDDKKTPRKDKDDKEEPAGSKIKSPRKEKDGKTTKKKKSPKTKEPETAESDVHPLDEPNDAHKMNVSAKSCPITSVTIYNDRAEVTRQVAVVVKHGLNEITVDGLSSKADRNSVRVSGGKGEAVILEVQFNSRWERKNKDEQTELGRLQREKEDVDEKIARLEEAMNRLKKEALWLEKWAKALSKPKPERDQKKAEEVDFFTPEMMEQAIGFLGFYEKRMADVDVRCAAIKKNLKDLQEEQEKFDKALANANKSETEEVHEAILLISAHKESEVELMLSYVVMGASWHAQYDVRVESNKEDLDLTYYGVITNNSLDDWTDAALSLSTAQPSVGGAPPELTTKFIGFRTYQYSHAWAAPSSSSMTRNLRAEHQISDIPAWDGVVGGMREEVDARPAPLAVMTAGVQESSICTNFTIPRRSTILSDGKPHKVTVRIVPLKAKFVYVVKPKLSTYAYLKASIRNTSEYPFLPGDINVFMDGNFVAKSNIKPVSPQETFGLYLGVDDAIKITYPPGVFFNDKQGIIRKGNVKTVKYQLTIKNTKAKDVQLTIFDQLPKPNDSQIKVKLLKPTIVEGQRDVVLNEANNLRWKVELAAGKTLQIPFEYQIEWPVGQELSGY